MFDVVVIGAGIQGAGVAQAAAAAGYRVAVLEQTGIAAGTSSRSSKLIHGGLRYLESCQFSLVKKALAERELLLKNAPQLVHLQPFYIPVYRHTSRRPLTIRAGLTLYALLGKVHASTRFHSLAKKDWAGLPVRNEDLQAVFCYQDAQTDDVALSKAVMQSARQLGAELLCPARFVGARLAGDHVDIEYSVQTGEDAVSASLSSRLMVNATGPWVNAVLHNTIPAVPVLDVELVQGTHIVVDDPAPDGVYYVEAPQDRRAIFIMPWQGKTLIGTTETVYHGEPQNVVPLAEEVVYLQQVYAYYFKQASTRVVDSFAGLRVLPVMASAPFSRPRDTILFIGPQRVLSLYGGKLTGYRATAEEVMQQLKKYLPSAKRIISTRDIKLQPVSQGRDE